MKTVKSAVEKTKISIWFQDFLNFKLTKIQHNTNRTDKFQQRNEEESALNSNK